MTYVKTLALALDYWACSVVYNQKDVTISSLTWMVEEGRLAPLKLSCWQLWTLEKLGPWLDRHWPNHRAQARTSDLERLRAAWEMLV